MRRRHPTVILAAVLAAFPTAEAAAPSIARVWDERALAAIRVDTPHPPAQARNLFSLSVAMYDAWAAYDPTAVGYVYRAKHTSSDVVAARREAISYAAYRILMERHVYSRTASETLAADTAQLTSLGYPPANISRDTTTPAGVGNAVYDAVSLHFQVQSTPNLETPFTNEGEAIRVLFDSLPIRRTNRLTEPQQFHRVISMPAH